MTTGELLASCRAAGIVLGVEGDRLTFAAPRGTVTVELRAVLLERKPELLAVLPRLDGMKANVGKVPIPCALLEAKGGPGFCFSCGARHEHPQAYGRCSACAIASEALYAEIPDAADRWPATRRADAVLA